MGGSATSPGSTLPPLEGGRGRSIGGAAGAASGRGVHPNLGNKKAAFSLSPWVLDRFLAFSWTLVHFLTLKIVAFLALWGTLTSLLS